MSTKIAIVTNGNYFARKILDQLLKSYGDDIRCVLLVTGDYHARSGFRAFYGIGRSTTIPYLLFKTIVHISFRLAQRIMPDAPLSVETMARKSGIPVSHEVSVNSDKARRWISSHEPDLLISVSCPQLIGDDIIDSAGKGGINIHSSLLPRYAGLAPYFWVLSKGEKITGTTVHFMAPRFDAGKILVQHELDIRAGESAFGLFLRLSNTGSSALQQAVDRLLDGDEGYEQNLSYSSYFSHPNLRSYRALRDRGHRLLYFRELLDTIRTEQRISDA